MFLLDDRVQQKLANEIYLTVEKLNGLSMQATRAGLTIDAELQSGGEVLGARGRTISIPLWRVVINRPFELVKMNDEVTNGETETGIGGESSPK
jgi:hypothetical protein